MNAERAIESGNLFAVDPTYHSRYGRTTTLEGIGRDVVSCETFDTKSGNEATGLEHELTCYGST